MAVREVHPEVMTDNKKGLLETVMDVAKASADEIVDRTRAAMSDVAANIGSDPQENAQDRADAAAARARADQHQTTYQGQMKDVDAQVKGALGEAKAKAGEYMDKAKVEAERLKTEAGRMAEQAQEGASRAGQDVKSAAEKMGRDASDAAGRMKDTASDAASKVSQTAKETAQDLKNEVNKP